jgi:hypothetical protein
LVVPSNLKIKGEKCMLGRLKKLLSYLYIIVFFGAPIWISFITHKIINVVLCVIFILLYELRVPIINYLFKKNSTEKQKIWADILIESICILITFWIYLNWTEDVFIAIITSVAISASKIRDNIKKLRSKP